MRYHKLVRDKIPEIIRNSGKDCFYSVLPEDEYLSMLDEKLNEEVAEYQESKSLEEIADILEVLRAIVLARGSTPAEVEALRTAKREERGGFERRILLEEVIAQE